MRTVVRLSAVASALLLASCAPAIYVSPVEVTRFIGDQPQSLGSGPIVVRAGPGGEADSLEFSLFRDAVAGELQNQGYVIVDGEAPQIAEVTVAQMVEQPGSTNRAVSSGVGVAGGTHSRSTSVGMGVGIDLTPRPSDRVHRELRVMIKPTAGGTALWEGRARFAASTNSDYGETQAAAAKLAGALFGGFPGQSGETIEVR
jgi:hypothetical protein